VLKIEDKDIHLDKRIIKQKMVKNDNLIKEIEDIRNKLNKIIIKENEITINEEVIEVSRKLDELIANYLNM